MRKVTRTLLGATIALPLAIAAAGVSTARAQCGPCKPKAARLCNPCAAKKAVAPGNPCAAKKVAAPCNPCAAKKAAAPCNPCAAKKK